MADRVQNKEVTIEYCPTGDMTGTPLFKYSEYIQVHGRVYCICVVQLSYLVVFGCEDCEDSQRFLAKRFR